MKAVGTHLELDGQPFTFTGMNIYNANSDDWCANNMDHGLFEQALSDIGLGGVHGGDHGVIRAWFFQPLATPDKTGPRDWTRFDRTIAAAKAAGYYVIPTLGNQWGECGHKGATAGYKTIDWYRTGYTQLQPEDAVYTTYASYRDWVAEVVARYKDEPAILAWQLLNEAETNADQPGGCPAGPEAYDALAPWASDVSGLIKSIDPNHLVSLGTIGTGQCGTSGAQYKALHAIPTIDLCEYHDYDPWAAMPGDAFNGLALRIQQCGELGKPLFVGEVGLRPVDVGGSYDSRTASLRAKLQTQRGAGVVGHVVWSWGPAPRSLNGYDIGPGDDVPALLAAGPSFATPTTPVDSDWVAPSITLTRPNRSLYTLNEPLTAAFACSEVGSSGLATCSGTMANGATIPTNVAGHFTFTVTTTDNIGNQRSTTLAYDVTAGDVTTTVPPGAATVTTDPGGFGASPAVPIQTSVAFTAPAGPVDAGLDRHARRRTSPRRAATRSWATRWTSTSTGSRARRTIRSSSPSSSTRARVPIRRRSRSRGPTRTTRPTSPPRATRCPRQARIRASRRRSSPEPARTCGSRSARPMPRSGSPSAARTPSPPTVTPKVTGTQGSNSWYRSDVGVSWTLADAQSAIVASTGCGPLDDLDRHAGDHGHLQGHERRRHDDESRHDQAGCEPADAHLPAGDVRAGVEVDRQGDRHRRAVRAGRFDGIGGRGHVICRAEGRSPERQGQGRQQRDRELPLHGRLQAGRAQAGRRDHGPARLDDPGPVQAPGFLRPRDRRQPRPEPRHLLLGHDLLHGRHPGLDLLPLRRPIGHVPVRSADLPDDGHGIADDHRPRVGRGHGRQHGIDQRDHPNVGPDPHSDPGPAPAAPPALSGASRPARPRSCRTPGGRASAGRRSRP